jgi:hypothetical protein
MQSRLRALRRFAAVLAALTGLTGALFLTGATARAQSVESGSLSLTSDPGDYVGQGESHNYSTGADTFTVSADWDGRSVGVHVATAGGGAWDLEFWAPTDESLAPGEYTDAIMPDAFSTGPFLDVHHSSRTCSQLIGSFDVTRVTFGSNGYVQQFDATFEQHCDSQDPGLRGEIHITNPPPPAALSLGVSVGADGTASALNGNATVHGAVTCSEPVDVTVDGHLTEVAHRSIIKGYFLTTVHCTPDAPVPWTATAVPNGTTPFQQGDVEAATNAAATDPVYHDYVIVGRTATVGLKHSST